MALPTGGRRLRLLPATSTGPSKRAKNAGGRAARQRTGSREVVEKLGIAGGPPRHPQACVRQGAGRARQSWRRRRCDSCCVRVSPLYLTQSGPGLPGILQAGDRDHALRMESGSISLAPPAPGWRWRTICRAPLWMEACRSFSHRRKAALTSLHMRHIYGDPAAPGRPPNGLCRRKNIGARR